MDQIKIGKFIASLRKQRHLTQEALGEKLGVTNKTVSRWETGNYLPDIGTLQLLSQEFDVSIDELIAGEFFSKGDIGRMTDESVIAVSQLNSFSMEERKAYFKQKWRKDHLSLLVLLGTFLMVSAVLSLVFGKPWLAGLVPVLALVLYGYQNNQMMAYVERRLYD